MSENMGKLYFMPSPPTELALAIQWFCHNELRKHTTAPKGQGKRSQNSLAPDIGISQPHISEIIALKALPELDAWTKIANWAHVNPPEELPIRAMRDWKNGGKEAYLERKRELLGNSVPAEILELLGAQKPQKKAQ